jgi:hypothetical protein
MRVLHLAELVEQAIVPEALAEQQVRLGHLAEVVVVVGRHLFHYLTVH